MATVMTSVLFTDLVDSTGLAERLGPAATDALRQTHFELLRGAIRAAGGDEVKNLGDGLMVTFSSPSRALACAVGMQQAVEHHNRRGREPLGLRVALSVGEATEEDGDFFGEPVVEASRLCGVAGAGQILTSELVRAMVGRHATYSLIPVGELELKGMSDPVAAFEVAWEPDVGAGGGVPLPARLVSAATESLFGFFGRSSELTALEEAQKRVAATSHVEMLLVAGEAGIGKTSLVAQAARRFHEAGTTVLLGRCQEDLSAPYRPWSEALSQLVQGRGVELLDGLAPAQRDGLGRVLPSLADPSSSTSGGDAESELVVFLEAVSALLGRAGDAAPVMVVLEDLHWADRASLQLIRQLVTGGADLRLLLVGTYRDTDVSAADPLSALLADLHRESGIGRLALRGLEDSELVELMAAAAGHELNERAVAFAHAVGRETDGNPFFAGELLRHLGETGAIYLGEDGQWAVSGDLDELGLPGSVRDVVGQRVRRLGERAVMVLSLAAVIGRDFDLELVAVLADLDEEVALQLLEAASVAALVNENDELPGRYRFTHALIQHTLYQDLSATRRQRTHHRIAIALEAEGRDDPAQAGELARHWLAATRPADLDKALHYVERAADAALAGLAPDDAINWYSQALELLSRQPSSDQTLRARLLLGLGAAQRLAGEPAYRDTLLAAARLAHANGDNDILTDAVLTNTQGTVSMDAVDEERRGIAEVALQTAGPGDSVARARLLAALAELNDPLDWQVRRDLAREAVTVASRLGDLATLVLVENQAQAALAQPENHQQRLAATAETVALADRLDQPSARFSARYNRLCALSDAGDVEAFDECLTELGAIATLTAWPYQQWQLCLVQAGRALLAGDLAAAEETANEGLALGTRYGIQSALAAYGGHLAAIRIQQGRTEEILELFSQAAADNPGTPSLQASVAMMHCQLGHLDEAQRLYAPIAAAGFVAFPRDQQLLVGLDRIATTAAALGDLAGAQELYDLLLPFADLVAATGATFVAGSVSHSLGCLARGLDRYDDAERHFHQALAMHERMRAPFLTARTQVDYAQLLIGRHDDGDPDAARQLLAQARLTAAEHGYAGLERRAADLSG